MNSLDKSQNIHFDPAKIKALAFDLDGTLVNSMGDFTEIAKLVIHKHFEVPLEEAALLYKKTSGIPFEFQLKSLFADHPHVPVATQEYEQEKLKEYFKNNFFEDVIKTLPDFQKQGYKICVSSNNYIYNVEKKMEPYKNYFDLILGYKDNFFKGKDHFEAIMARFRLKLENILFIGDSLHDAKMAYDNGVAFVARLGTFSAKDFDDLKLPLTKVDNYFELERYLGVKK